MTIGERIKQARKEKGLTQKRLGELSGTSEGTVKQYELGKRQPRLAQLQAIAAALGLPTASLLIGSPPLDDDFPAQLPEDVQQVASSMEQMNEEGRGKVVDYAEDLEASGRYKKRGTSGMGKEA